MLRVKVKKIFNLTRHLKNVVLVRDAAKDVNTTVIHVLCELPKVYRNAPGNHSQDETAKVGF